MLQPGGAAAETAATLAGGGVSRPEELLDSGELMGVRVTEEISRHDRDQKREEGRARRSEEGEERQGRGCRSEGEKEEQREK